MAQIKFDPNDLDGMRQIMAEYGKDGLLTIGESVSGESVVLSVCSDHITTTTLQRNGWTRVNTYWHDGTTEEAYKHGRV